MHFADGFCLVPGFAGQACRKCCCLVKVRLVVLSKIGEATQLRAGFSGQHRYTLGHADGAIRIGPGKIDSLGCQLVQVRRHNRVCVAVQPETVATPLVGDDVNDVGPALFHVFCVSAQFFIWRFFITVSVAFRAISTTFIPSSALVNSSECPVYKAFAHSAYIPGKLFSLWNSNPVVPEVLRI